MQLTREHSGIAENILNTAIDESVTVYELFKESGISMEHAEKTAKIIENSFNEYSRKKNMKIGDHNNSSKVIERDVSRKIMHSCNLTRDEDQKLRKIVQICFKNFYFREKSYKLKATRLPDYLANRAEKTLDVYRRSAPKKTKLEKAAIVIQSAYRSYFVRKMPKELQRFHECATKIQARFRGYMAQKKYQRATAAAIKIQAMFRGCKARKSLLNRISSVQSIERKSKFMGIIRSTVSNIVNESMGVIDYEPKEQPFVLMSNIVNEIVNDSLGHDRVCSRELLDSGVTSSALYNVDASSKEEMAARKIQKVFRGFQERKKLSSKTNLMNETNYDVPTITTIEQQILEVIDSIQDSIAFD